MNRKKQSNRVQEHEMTSKRVLVFKNRAIGDAVITLSAISYLKASDQELLIDYAVPFKIAPLFKNTVSDFMEILPFDLKSVRGWLKFWSTLRKKRYDAILDFHQSGSSRNFFRIYSFLTGTPYHFNNHQQTERAPAITRDLVLITKFLKRSETPTHLEWPPVMRLNECSKKRRVIFGIVATRETKMWPLQNFAELSKTIFKHDPEIEIVIPISKSVVDEELKQRMMTLPISSRVIFVQESLESIPKILGEAILYVGNDTGLKHIAASLGVPTVTFFGPEEPYEWHPYDLEKHHYFFITPLACRTRTSHYCGLMTCDSMICLSQITSDNVWQKIKSML